jgi:cytidyltransferase-like protein
VNEVCIVASFDNLQSRHVRLLEEAAQLGPVHVLLLSDQLAHELSGTQPKFPQEERQYFVQAIRFVTRLSLLERWDDRDALPALAGSGTKTWVVDARDDRPARRAYCQARGLTYMSLSDDRLSGFPTVTRSLATNSAAGPRKKVLVTGCYDWLHSGHVRFFEEVAEFGDLYVVLGHDANIALLKGPGHPLFGQAERRYMVGAIRYVHTALVATGHGWLDAEPEIGEIQPDIYAVNEDGDRPEKREFCRTHGIDYRVLARLPKDGLLQRQSTALRGF